jgi:hypothetical protein
MKVNRQQNERILFWVYLGENKKTIADGFSLGCWCCHCTNITIGTIWQKRLYSTGNVSYLRVAAV